MTTPPEMGEGEEKEEEASKMTPAGLALGMAPEETTMKTPSEMAP